MPLRRDIFHLVQRRKKHHLRRETGGHASSLSYLAVPCSHETSINECTPACLRVVREEVVDAVYVVVRVDLVLRAKKLLLGSYAAGLSSTGRRWRAHMGGGETRVLNMHAYETTMFYTELKW